MDRDSWDTSTQIGSRGGVTGWLDMHHCPFSIGAWRGSAGHDACWHEDSTLSLCPSAALLPPYASRSCIIGSGSGDAATSTPHPPPNRIAWSVARRVSCSVRRLPRPPAVTDHLPSSGIAVTPPHRHGPPVSGRSCAPQAVLFDPNRLPGILWWQLRHKRGMCSRRSALHTKPVPPQHVVCWLCQQVPRPNVETLEGDFRTTGTGRRNSAHGVHMPYSCSITAYFVSEGPISAGQMQCCLGMGVLRYKKKTEGGSNPGRMGVRTPRTVGVGCRTQQALCHPPLRQFDSRQLMCKSFVVAFGFVGRCGTRR